MRAIDYVTRGNPEPFVIGERGRVLWHSAEVATVKLHGYHGRTRQVVRCYRYLPKGGQISKCVPFDAELFPQPR